MAYVWCEEDKINSYSYSYSYSYCIFCDFFVSEGTYLRYWIGTYYCIFCDFFYSIVLYPVPSHVPTVTKLTVLYQNMYNIIIHVRQLLQSATPPH
jgi:hypothetical protein